MPVRVSSARFVGRVSELAALEAALERAAGGRSAAVLIGGDAGIGKSRLVAEFEARARAADTDVLVGECIEVAEGELPYGPIVAALRSLVRESHEGALESLPIAARGVLARLWPELSDLQTSNEPAEFGRGQLFEAVHRLVAARAAERTLVVVIEDLQWADRSSLELLTFLVRNSRGERVLFVATYRSDEVHRRHPVHKVVSELERGRRAQRIALQPFDEAELREQLANILGAEPDRPLVRRLLERSEGNPFFAEELLAATDAGVLPDSLLDALLARVERLSEPARRVLQLAATVGRPVGHTLLARASDAQEAELLDALREAVSQRILIQTQDGTAYAFRHELLREAIYTDLLPGERVALHAALGAALADDPGLAVDGKAVAELALHWHAAGRMDAALSASLDAAAEAESVHAYAEAHRHFERALELADRVNSGEAPAVSVQDLSRRAADAAQLAGEARRAITLARRIIAAVDAQAEPVAAGLDHARLARNLWLDGRGDEALQHYATALELVPTRPTVERAEVLAANAQVLMLTGHMREAHDRASEALEIARAVGARRAEASALNTMGPSAFGLRDDADVIPDLRLARAIAEEIGAVEEIGRSYINESHLLEEQGRLEESVAIAEEGLTRARALGAARMWGDYLASDVAGRLAMLGDWDTASRRARDVIDLTLTPVNAASAHGVLGQLAAERGSFEQAAEHVALSEELSRSAGGPMWAGPNSSTLLTAALWQGDLDKALEVLRRAFDVLRGPETLSSFTAPLYALAVRAHGDRAERARALGHESEVSDETEAAHAVITRLEAMSRQAGMAEAHRQHALARAELSRLHGDRDPAPWIEVAEMWNTAGRPYPAAYARWRAAEMTVRSNGLAADAESLARAAAATAHTLGARPLLDELSRLARRARLDLGSEAAAPGPAARGPDPGLTERETDVLRLLAEGHTNRQIGEQLFMSQKTASVHVSRILSKLNARNRAEAAGIAHALGLTSVDNSSG